MVKSVMIAAVLLAMTAQANADRGVHAGSCTPAMTDDPLTKSEFEALRFQGEWGQTKSRIGMVSTLVGLGLGGYAFYKGFIEDDDTEPSLIVAPAITPTSGGATLQLRW